MLTETIKWLHDYRKGLNEQLRVQASNLSGQQRLGRNELTNRFLALSSININLTGRN